MLMQLRIAHAESYFLWSSVGGARCAMMRPDLEELDLAGPSDEHAPRRSHV